MIANKNLEEFNEVMTVMKREAEDNANEQSATMP